MADYYISEEIYPIAAMTLSSLEHAALLPARFVDLVKSASDLEPTLTCRLPCHLTSNEESMYGVSREGKPSCFVAALGGRYLVIKAYHQLKNPNQGNSEASVLTLWDFGASQLQPKVIAKMVIPMVECRLRGLVFDPRPVHHGTLYLFCLNEKTK